MANIWDFLFLGGILATVAGAGAIVALIIVALFKRDWKLVWKRIVLSFAGFMVVDFALCTLGVVVAVDRSFGAVGGADASSKATTLAATISELMNMSGYIFLGGMVVGTALAWRGRSPVAI